MDDGYVLPHFLNYRGPDVSGYEKSLNDSYLRVGRVSKAYAPNDKANLNKRYIEYDVEVEHSENGLNFNTVTYPRARIVSLFGGIADFVRFTPRIATPKPQKLNEGSQVLLLCINGDTKQSVIIGGIPHPGLEKDDPTKGHNFEFSFNGIEITINKDGELEARFRGATKLDGTLADSADPQAEGTFASFTKTGTIEVESKKELHVVAKEHVNIESAGVNLGGKDVTDAQMLGTTFREEQAALHAKLKSALDSISSALAQAGTACTAGAVIVPPLSGAASALTSASRAASDMKSAIEDFEAKSEDFLSKVNRLN